MAFPGSTVGERGKFADDVPFTGMYVFRSRLATFCLQHFIEKADENFHMAQQFRRKPALQDPTLGEHEQSFVKVSLFLPATKTFIHGIDELSLSLL
jgi:hypothetical protein